MPKQVYIESLKDFTGGLNLGQDVFDLARNESPDLMNVEIDVRGGFQVREGVHRTGTTRTSANAQSRRLAYFESGATKALVMGGTVDDKAAYLTGPNTAITSITAMSAPATITQCAYAQALGNLYENGWTSTTGRASRVSAAFAKTALGQAFNDTNIHAGGNMPFAKCMVQHVGRMWIGNTLEGGTQFPSRVRWSYASNTTGTQGAEDWLTNGYIDINLGVSGDEIIQLVPYGDRLFVFMRNAIHVITGVDDASFAVTTISTEYGACGANAVVATPAGIFFFDWPTGLNVITYDGTSRYLFDKMLPAITKTTGIPDSYQDLISLGYFARRVWVSVPYGSSATENNRTYVLDLGVGSGSRFGAKTPIAEGGRSGGAWSQYDFGVAAFYTWQPTGGEALFIGIGCHATTTGKRNWLLQLTATGQYMDDLDSGADTHIDAYLVTPWINLGVPTSPKRFRRAFFVMKADPTVGAPRVFCDIYKDFDDSVIYKSFEVTPSVTVVSGSTGAGNLIWGTGIWNTGLWGGAAATVTATNFIVKGGTVGNARAIRLRISCSEIINTLSSDQRMWGMNAVDMRYTPRRIR